MTKPAGVLVTAVFLVLGGLRRWWVGTRSLTKHGSRRRRLFGRCRAGVVSGRGVLVVGAVCRLSVWTVRFQQSRTLNHLKSSKVPGFLRTEDLGVGPLQARIVGGR